MKKGLIALTLAALSLPVEMPSEKIRLTRSCQAGYPLPKYGKTGVARARRDAKRRRAERMFNLNPKR